MVFSSITFLIYFLPCLLLFYYIVPSGRSGIKNYVLLLFSLLFYSFGGTQYLLLLIVSIAIDYTSGLLASRGNPGFIRRIGVFTACAGGLGLLIWFKYSGFLAEIINSFGAAIEVPQIVLPIGISFYTFQGLSYVIDVYRGDAEAQKNPMVLALYISLFPQLVAGPIVRYSTIEYELYNREENLDDFCDGLVRFLIGLAKKMVIANSMGKVADTIFAESTAALPLAVAWMGAFAYTFQIYYDFSAYSDMAIGLGRMFGFRFEENFNYPYTATSVTEFWRKWHISLSSWFRDYVYIPLGGSYCSTAKNIRNLAVVWLLTGMWHGASWNFIIWGIWYFIFLTIEKLMRNHPFMEPPDWLMHVYVMLVVIIGWVIFRADDLGTTGYMLGSMFLFCNDGFNFNEAVYYFIEYWPEWVMAILASAPLKFRIYDELDYRAGQGSRLAEAALIWGPKLFALLMLVISYMKLVTGSFNPFIYFQF